MRALATLLLVLAAAPVWAQTPVEELRGTTTSGSAYVVQVPQGWIPSDGLVFYHHGFDGELVTNPDLGPLRESLLARGYALAAAGYSQRGWALFNASRDTQEVYSIFVGRRQAPGRVLHYGGSMGGLIAAQMADENRQLPNSVGALSLCAPLGGHRTFEQIFDLKLSYDAICAGVGGGEFPRGDAPYPWALNLSDVPDDLGNALDRDNLRLIARVTQCLGLTLPSVLRAPTQRERLAKLKSVSGITDEETLLSALVYATYGLADVLRSPDKMNGRNPFDNRLVDYGDASLNARIERVSADPMAALDFKWASSVRGRYQGQKVLAIHTTRDQLVFPEHTNAISVSPAENLVRATVVEQEVGHCAFTEREVVAAFDALDTWTQGGEPATADVLQQRCLNSEPSSEPCRYSAMLISGSYDRHARPRNLGETEFDRLATGLWFDPSRSGEGLSIEVLDQGRAWVAWFTYQPNPATGQRWIVGEGRLFDETLVVDSAYAGSGARFGAQFDPQQVQLTRFGRLEFVRSGDQQLRLRWEDAGIDGAGELSLTQLTRVAAASAELSSPHSGSWFEAARPGHGLHLSALPNGQAVLVWYTFDPDGGPAWVYAEGQQRGNSIDFAQGQITRGTSFGDAFDAARLAVVPFGSLRLIFNNCQSGLLAYSSVLPGFGAGSHNLDRLTSPVGLGACTR